MTKKEEKQARQRLAGRNPKMEGLLIGTIFMMAAVVGGMEALLHIGGTMEANRNPALTVVLIIYGGVALGLVLVLVDHFKMGAELKEKQERLLESSKQRLLSLAARYQTKYGIQSEQEYVYGNMAKGFHGSTRIHRMICFHYLRYSELLWVYQIQTSIAMTNQYGAGPNVIQDHRQDRVRIYDIYGDVYDVLVHRGDSDVVMKRIKEHNSRCRLGYSKDGEIWLKEQRANQI